MAVHIPDPIAVARQQAELLRQHGDVFLQGAVDRVLADCPFIDAAALITGLEAFHAERMARIPSSSRYPEAAAWVEYVLTVDRELQELTGLSDAQLAQYRSLGAYLTFRGYAGAKPAPAEKCRVLYAPDTDRGQLHIKNVDDPITFWKPNPDPACPYGDQPLLWDGVGSGLHIDDEPEEIFPLPYYTMCMTHCDDVPGAVEFLTRYASFWGGQNIVLRDRQQRSVAIEKTSYNFIEVFQPGPHGDSHCSGMVSRDPQSPQGRYVRQRRQQYLQAFGQGEDGTDMTFWNACDRAERMLADFLARPGQIKVDDVIALFTTFWPEGLNKNGTKLHPGQSVEEYTLVTHFALLDQRKYYIWQRDLAGKYPDSPLILDY